MVDQDTRFKIFIVASISTFISFVLLIVLFVQMSKSSSFSKIYETAQCTVYTLKRIQAPVLQNVSETVEVKPCYYYRHLNGFNLPNEYIIGDPDVVSPGLIAATVILSLGSIATCVGLKIYAPVQV
jgi:hypothetical protein